MPHIGWLLLYIAVTTVKGEGKFPPYIEIPKDNNWPEPIIYIRVDDNKQNQTIHCKARAQPEATYSWTVNDTEFSSSRPKHISYDNATGVLTISVFTANDNGEYQCRASNCYGTVLTPYLTLLALKADAFSGQDVNESLEAQLHQYLKLDCKNIPASVPRWDFKWEMQNKSLSIQVQQDQRMSVDPDGNLHILWIENSDDKAIFTCIVVNKRLLSEAKNRHSYQLQVKPGKQSVTDPMLRYHSDVVAMAGTTAKLTCIFSYYSSSGENLTIDWYRQGTIINTTNNTRSFGRVLQIANVQVPTSARNESGEYQCHPKIGELPKDKLTAGRVNLNIIAPPEFVKYMAPVNTSVHAGQDAVFKCYAESYNASKKHPIWLINGKPLVGCPPHMFECKLKLPNHQGEQPSVCIQDRLLCNNCTDRSDEHNCLTERCRQGQGACTPTNHTCTFPQLRCYNDFTKCLQKTQLCDGTSDCTDGSDELLSPYENKFKANRYKFNPELTEMTIPTVTPHDIMCVQCMVSNEYGTIVGNGCIIETPSTEKSQVFLSDITGTYACLGLLVPLTVWFVFHSRRKRRERFTMSLVSTSINTDSAYGIEIIAETLEVTLATNNKQSDFTDSVEYSNMPSEHIVVPDSEVMPENAIMIEKFFDQVFTEGDTLLNLEKQFEALPRGLRAAHEAALKPENKNKNRYKHMYAYDDTRVVLQTDDEENGDYINASFIQGFTKPQAYVASQGPTEEVLDDFWRMVWQLNSRKIIMLTNLVENNMVKCKQYWPSGGQEMYGKVSVAFFSSELFHDYTIRTFVVKKNSTERLVTQFHFTTWPNNDLQSIVCSFAKFFRKIKYASLESNGPMIVHCSAGVGRTGTFIALDYLTDQSKELGYVDVFGCVLSLRMQRLDLVQTLEQYQFVHQVLVELFMLSSSGFPSSFPKVYQELLQIDPRKKKRKLDIEYEMMTTLSPTDDTCDYKFIQCSLDRAKNRYHDVLPVAEFMPITGCSPDSVSSYINAVFLPNYKQPNGFIITQSPLESTMQDFWKLIDTYNVHTIVMMNEISELKVEEIYWPTKEKRLLFGHMVISLSKTRVVNGNVVLVIKLTKFQIRRKIKLFQCGHWKACEELPESAFAILDLLELVEVWQQQTGNNTILVHCMNGALKSGLFCVISAVIERLKIEQDVAISQCIQEMRRRREQIICSVKQFQFCHEVILAFLQQNDTYSNCNSVLRPNELATDGKNFDLETKN